MSLRTAFSQLPRPLLLPAIVSLALVLLSACTSLPTAQVADWQAHQASLAAVQQWTLRGRLNIRQNRQSETVNLNWQQAPQEFSIRMSGALGLGAVNLHGDQSGVTLEKSGEEPVLLPTLDAMSQDYLGYDFPAAYLLYWVRGLPAPGLQASNTTNDQNLLQTLIQTDTSGQRWDLAFESYQAVDTLVLPKRIKMQSQGVQLTFLIDKWQLTASDL